MKKNKSKINDIKKQENKAQRKKAILKGTAIVSLATAALIGIAIGLFAFINNMKSDDENSKINPVNQVNEQIEESGDEAQESSEESISGETEKDLQEDGLNNFKER